MVRILPPLLLPAACAGVLPASGRPMIGPMDHPAGTMPLVGLGVTFGVRGSSRLHRLGSPVRPHEHYHGVRCGYGAAWRSAPDRSPTRGGSSWLEDDQEPLAPRLPQRWRTRQAPRRSAM